MWTVRRHAGAWGRLPAMHLKGALLGLVATAGAASAAPVAVAREDVDGDGAADPIELSADGRLQIGAGKRAEIKLAPAVTRGRIRVGKTGAAVQIVVELTAGTQEEAVVLEARL